MLAMKDERDDYTLFHIYQTGMQSSWSGCVLLASSRSSESIFVFALDGVFGWVSGWQASPRNQCNYTSKSQPPSRFRVSMYSQTKPLSSPSAHPNLDHLAYPDHPPCSYPLLARPCIMTTQRHSQTPFSQRSAEYPPYPLFLFLIASRTSICTSSPQASQKHAGTSQSTRARPKIGSSGLGSRCMRCRIARGEERWIVRIASGRDCVGVRDGDVWLERFGIEGFFPTFSNGKMRF